MQLAWFAKSLNPTLQECVSNLQARGFGPKGESMNRFEIHTRNVAGCTVWDVLDTETGIELKFYTYGEMAAFVTTAP